MKNVNIFNELKAIISDLNVGADITPDSALLREGILDSMDWLAYLGRIEERFGVKIGANAEQMQLGLMNNMVSYIQEHIK